MNRIKPRKRKPSRVFHRYPPDDGGMIHLIWKFAYFCVPCRYTTRKHLGEEPRCQRCNGPMDHIVHGRIPKRQDSWWDSKETLANWALFILTAKKVDSND